MKRESGSCAGLGWGSALGAHQQTPMKRHFFPPALLAHRLFISAALTAISFLPGRAQTPPEQLAPFLTTATRTPAEPQTIGSAVDVVSAADLARRQMNSLAQALG